MAKNNTRFICTIMILALIIIVGGVSPARSVDFKDYEKIKDSKEFKLYIKGVGEGISWANTALEARGSKLLFCQPNKLALGSKNYLDILRREIGENADVYKIDTPVEAILLRGIINTFPCK
jgi:hypothetical protein